MSRRIAFLDGVKGFCILSIVLGHVFIPGWNNFIFLYHLPLFFLLAGYFTTTRHSVGEVVKGRARRLLVPYCFSAALVVVLSIPKSLLEHTSVLGGLKKWGLAALSGVGVEPTVPLHMESIGAIWFLWALFWGTILLRLLIGTEYKYFRLAAVLALFIVAVVSVKTVFLPLSLQAAAAALLWMYLGWYFRQWKERLNQERAAGTDLGTTYDKYGRAAFGVVFILALAVWLQAAFHYQPFLMVSATFDAGMLGIIGSFGGSIVVCSAIYVLYKFEDRFARPVCAALTWLGQNSLALLCAHVLEQDLIPWKPLYSGAGLTGPGFYAAVFFSKLAFTLAVGIFFAKAPGLRKLFRE